MLTIIFKAKGGFYKMKFELLVIIIILIVIAIMSLAFSIWDIFITKKRTTAFSASDLYYGMIIGVLAGITVNVYIMVTTVLVLAIWLTVIGIKCGKNRKEKDIN